MLLGMGMTSCSDFLDKPVEDNYNTENFYNGDAACISGVNYLSNSPWYDFQRGFIKIGEVMSGNMYCMLMAAFWSLSMTIPQL